MYKGRISFSGLLSVVFLLAACTPENPYEQAASRSREMVKNLMEQNQVPGLSVSVSVGGKLVWSEGFGYAELEHRVPVDPATTLFRIGSVSKPYTAAALARLSEQGKISLDDPVQEYVPSFPWKSDSISLRLLAGHLSGIRHYRGDEFLLNKYYPTVNEGLDIFIRDSLLFPPGTRYSYSSYAWNLISAAMESASGKDFLTLMQEEVFSPLGMTATFPDYSDSIMSGRTAFYLTDSLHRVIHAPDVDNSYKWAGGGFISTSEDMIRFANGHLDGGFISPPTLEEWTTPQHTLSGENTGYGIGWNSRTNALGMHWFGHSGGSVGGTTQLIVYPESGVVVAMVTNMSGVSYGDVHHRIACLFMPGEPLAQAADTTVFPSLTGHYTEENSGVEFDILTTPEGWLMAGETSSTLLLPEGDSLLVSLDGVRKYRVEPSDSAEWEIRMGKRFRAIRDKK